MINSTWRMNFQNVPRFSIEKKWKIGVSRSDVASQWNIFHLEDELQEITLVFYDSLKKIAKSEQRWHKGITGIIR